MKKRFLYFIAFFLWFSFSYSQNAPDSSKSNVRGIIKGYPLQAVSGEIRLSYEKPIKHNMSLELGCGYMFAVTSFEIGSVGFGALSGQEFYGANGFTLREGIKFYLSKSKDHYGFYFSPLIMGKYYYQRPLGFHIEFSHVYIFGIQALVGYRFNSNNTFSYEIYGGLGGKMCIDKMEYIGGVYNSYTFTNSFLIPQLGFAMDI